MSVAEEMLGEGFLDYVPMDALLRMLPIINSSGYKDDEHLEWNGLVWYVAVLRAAMWV